MKLLLVLAGVVFIVLVSAKFLIHSTCGGGDGIPWWPNSGCVCKGILLGSVSSLPIVGGGAKYCVGILEDNTKQKIQQTIIAQDSPVISWKTYRSTKYGFSFSYPESYIVKETELANANFKGGPFPEFSVTDPNGKGALSAEYPIEYGIAERGYKPEEYFVANNDPLIIRTSHYSLWTYSHRQIGGTCFYTDGDIKDGEDGVDCFTDIFSPHLVIQLSPQSGADELNEDQLQVFDKIVSSYKPHR
jgi:hypothetical protein